MALNSAGGRVVMPEDIPSQSAKLT
jgi:hypothetical protein